MTRLRRWIFLALVLLGSQLSVGCYLGVTNRPVLFPNVALSPAIARPGTTGGVCGPGCYREFGPNGCGGSLFAGSGGGFGAAPVVTGPVYDAPLVAGPTYGGYVTPGYGAGFTAPAPSPGCAGCAAHTDGFSGIPIAGGVGGPPIAMTPTGGPIHGVPVDSGTVPTLKPPGGSVPLQMPSEIKESKKILSVTGK